MSSLPDDAPESTEAAALTSAATCELCGYHAPVAAFVFEEVRDPYTLQPSCFPRCADRVACGNRLYAQQAADFSRLFPSSPPLLTIDPEPAPLCQNCRQNPARFASPYCGFCASLKTPQRDDEAPLPF